MRQGEREGEGRLGVGGTVVVVGTTLWRKRGPVGWEMYLVYMYLVHFNLHPLTYLSFPTVICVEEQVLQWVECKL